MTTPNPQNDQFDINETGYKTSYTAIRKARRFAVQGLYEWLMTDYRFANESRDLLGGNEPYTIVARTRADNAMHTVHLGYYHELMRQIPDKTGELIVEISRYLDRSFEKLDTIEKAILLIGAYELKHSLHIPYKVVLDEAMQLNTHFGATDAHKFINAILDRYAKDVRELEYGPIKLRKKPKKKVNNKKGG
ncbi:transcription antitermination factor NusB [Moraxella equi]|uniref:Transcription antitermination protein NusB n=1 Tax=Moraxella equi TaxID=60442 RepID=A0A378QQZ0_9GAMM|nr:transcription antitermination factor NusB [Moraxella equi]OPH39877.1 transcription antitermination factor NusB [Moraxella equi]STZ03295.1 N utilization substance protein B homolog [Moraxella equi]